MRTQYDSDVKVFNVCEEKPVTIIKAIVIAISRECQRGFLEARINSSVALLITVL